MREMAIEAAGVTARRSRLTWAGETEGNAMTGGWCSGRWKYPASDGWRFEAFAAATEESHGRQPPKPIATAPSLKDR
jgi:hypothetical protein